MEFYKNYCIEDLTFEFQGIVYKEEWLPVYKKIIDINTGIVYDSVYHLIKIIGGSGKEMRRKLNGEHQNKTPYRYFDGEKHRHYPIQNEKDIARYYELRPKIYGVAI